jgi:hypothetical protein
MKAKKYKLISRSINVFHGRQLPESETFLAGYSALVDVFELKVPLPERLAAISHQHRKYETNEWMIYTPRYKPDDTIESHLTFAIKHEGLDLGILKSLFQKINAQVLEIGAVANKNEG